MVRVQENLSLKRYHIIQEELNSWPSWKKELVNDSLLVSSHAKKLPLYVDGDSSGKVLSSGSQPSNIPEGFVDEELEGANKAI